MTNEKIHLRDVKEVDATIKTKAWRVGETVYNRLTYPTAEQLATHRDCERCEKEFKKRFYYLKFCPDCQDIINTEKFKSLALIEWDFETPLCVWDSDEYFFDAGELVDFIEDNEELSLEDLKLVTCYQTTFKNIDFDNWQDDLHEDWKPSKEFEEKLKDFNEFLKKESTNTWMPTKKRVSLYIKDNLIYNGDR